MSKHNGVAWVSLSEELLPKHIQEQHREMEVAWRTYLRKCVSLMDALKNEWTARYPEGRKGETMMFNVTGGKLLCATKKVEVRPMYDPFAD